VSKLKLSQKPHKEVIIFDSNEHALNVSGPGEANLIYLKKLLPVEIKGRGNELSIDGPKDSVEIAKKSLEYLRENSRKGDAIKTSDIMDCVRAYQRDSDVDLHKTFKSHVIISAKKKICPRTLGQKNYVEAIANHDIVFGIGPAGTGKTYLAMAMAVAKMLKGEVERIVLTRPAVEAGEKLGFLPGDLAEKVNPYLRPLIDALHEMVEYEQAERMLASGQIEIAPIAFMRGRTLNDSYVILDEAQNCTREQMKMFLTRIGENSRAVITGDITQIDLPRESKSGLIQAVKLLSDVDGIHIHQFTEKDVVRHRLVEEIIKAYDKAKRIP
jgi:phosphate starvation-inducible protein PhoH and related proteins